LTIPEHTFKRPWPVRKIRLAGDYDATVFGTILCNIPSDYL
jgi:hypothetical protein